MIYTQSSSLRSSAFTEKELIESIQFMNELGRMTDDALAQRGLQIGEPQKIYHFIRAVRSRQSTLLPKQAETLLRLTPLLAPKGSNMVHDAILTGAPLVKSLYEQSTTLEDKKRYAAAMKTAGMVCVSKRLGATSYENRTQEYALFKPFIGDTQEYRESEDRFQRRKNVGRNALADAAKEPVQVMSSNPFGYARSPKSFERDYS
ncbi:MAG: hypothetical protein IJV07_00810 [Alphaproteobacteria bacterium]|nr:hypothetical protein [Alphaproteobacteria bacterium]